MNSEKQNKEELLYRQLADYARFPEMNPGPVCRIDITGKVLLANKAARNLFGEDDLIGGNWLNICPDFTNEMWEEILNSNESISIESKVNEKVIMFSYILSDDKDLVFAFGTDITRLRVVEKQLADYARFPDMNPAPVLRLNLEGFVLLSNEAARNIFGYDLVGKCWRDICPGMKNDNTWESICGATDEPYYIEVRIDNKDFMFAHRRDSIRNLLFAYGADITLTKKAERALRQSEKMATLGTLAAGVAHEINNPAAAVQRAAEQISEAFALLEKSHFQLSTINFTEKSLEALQVIEQQARDFAIHPIELDAITRFDRETEIEDWFNNNNLDNTWDLAPKLVEQGFDTSLLTKYFNLLPDDSLVTVLKWAASIFGVLVLMNDIKQSSMRISEIVGALKSYSYLGQAPVQLINVHEGLDNTLIILRSKLKNGINIIRNYERNLPLISAFGSELNQVWTNIIDNAVDAMQGRGQIIIRSMKNETNIIIEIEDNGPGIPQDMQSRIFDPFFTTKEPGKGTGLGLSTCYSIIVEKHKGKISVNSKPGQTCFKVILPIESQES